MTVIIKKEIEGTGQSVEFILSELDDDRWSLTCPADRIPDEIDWPEDDLIRSQAGIAVQFERWDEGSSQSEAIGYPVGWKPELGDGPYEYELAEDGNVYRTTTADTAAEALAEAAAETRDGAWDLREGTIWVDVSATNVADEDDHAS